jgi:uridine kinase
VCIPSDDDTRLMRRIKRDVAERGRDVMNVLEQYQKFVKPAFDQFVAPSRRCVLTREVCMWLVHSL